MAISAFFAMGPAAPAAEQNCTPEVSFKVVENPPRLSGTVTFSVTLRNPAKTTANCTLPSAQIYDVVVRREGQTAWRWSGDKRFASVLMPHALAAGGARTYRAKWEATEGALRDTLGDRVKPGEYEAVAIFKARPEVQSAPVSFRIFPPKDH